MVRGFIKDQAVRTADHHLAQKTAHLLTAGEHLDLLHTVLPCKEHTYDEYLASDEMARKRTSVYTAEAEDESGAGIPEIPELCSR